MSKGEIQYLVTFAAGIAAFWLSGQAVAQLADPHLGHFIAEAWHLSVTLGVYGLCMAALAVLIYGRSRNAKAIIVAAVCAVILAAVGAQLLLHLIGLVHTKQDLGFFTFAAYLLYGLFYVVSAAVGRRFAR